VREIALSPRQFGKHWKLGFDAIIQQVSDPASWTIGESSRLIFDLIGLAEVSKTLIRNRVMSAAEFDYYREEGGNRREAYAVDVTLFESVFACSRVWDHAFETPEIGGYQSVDDIGDSAFASLGKWSLEGKTFVRRNNIVFSVFGFGTETSPKELASQFDAHVLSLTRV